MKVETYNFSNSPVLFTISVVFVTLVGAWCALLAFTENRDEAE